MTDHYVNSGKNEVYYLYYLGEKTQLEFGLFTSIDDVDGFDQHISLEIID